MRSYKLAEINYSASPIFNSLRLTAEWHICLINLTIIGSDNGLSPQWHQAIIWTNAGISLIRTLGTNLSEILSKIYTFSFKEMHFKKSSANWQPFCPSLNVLIILNISYRTIYYAYFTHIQLFWNTLLYGMNIHGRPIACSFDAMMYPLRPGVLPFINID